MRKTFLGIALAGALSGVCVPGAFAAVTTVTTFGSCSLYDTNCSTQVSGLAITFTTTLKSGATKVTTTCEATVTDPPTSPVVCSPANTHAKCNNNGTLTGNWYEGVVPNGQAIMTCQ